MCYMYINVQKSTRCSYHGGNKIPSLPMRAYMLVPNIALLRFSAFVESHCHRLPHLQHATENLPNPKLVHWGASLCPTRLRHQAQCLHSPEGNLGANHLLDQWWARYWKYSWSAWWIRNILNFRDVEIIPVDHWYGGRLGGTVAHLRYQWNSAWRTWPK